MGLTLNELYKLDNEILRSLVLPNLSQPVTGEWLAGREFHDEIVRPNLMLQCGHFETLHNSPAKFRDELSMWSKMRFSVWSDMLRTTVQKYTLTHNYERYEESSETRNIDESGKTTRTNNTSGITSNVGSGESFNEQSRNNNTTVENTVAAYNDLSYSPKDKTLENNSESGTGKDSYKNSSNTSHNSNVNGTDNSEKKAAETVTHKSKIYGNVGVTTAQQMLKEERELVLMNIVQFIIDDFKEYFCIMLY